MPSAARPDPPVHKHYSAAAAWPAMYSMLTCIGKAFKYVYDLHTLFVLEQI